MNRAAGRATDPERKRTSYVKQLRGNSNLGRKLSRGETRKTLGLNRIKTNETDTEQR